MVHETKFKTFLDKFRQIQFTHLSIKNAMATFVCRQDTHKQNSQYFFRSMFVESVDRSAVYGNVIKIVDRFRNLTEHYKL